MTCSCHSDKYIDELGTTWLPPTAEAYYRVCKALEAAQANLRIAHINIDSMSATVKAYQQRIEKLTTP